MNQSSSSIISFGVNSVLMPCSELSSLSNLLYALKHYKIKLQVSVLVQQRLTKDFGEIH